MVLIDYWSARTTCFLTCFVICAFTSSTAAINFIFIITIAFGFQKGGETNLAASTSKKVLKYHSVQAERLMTSFISSLFGRGSKTAGTAKQKVAMITNFSACPLGLHLLDRLSESNTKVVAVAHDASRF